ncbi:MAG TPA: hypothetical protein VGM75_20325 [Pseudonocardiaceae bacterium]
MSWAEDTCFPGDLARAGWQPGNPAWGHCDITALLANDRHGFHWWKRFSNGVELDLTREQFRMARP